MDDRTGENKATSPVSERDVVLAARTASKLAELSDATEPVPVRFGMAGEESVQIPAQAVRLLREMLDQMARGYAVALTPMHTELTTRQAADLLQVSRTFLVRLLDEGRIPCRKVGAHRRVRTDDILAYRRETESRRRDAQGGFVLHGFFNPHNEIRAGLDILREL